MNKLILTNTGGDPIFLDDLQWNDEAYRAAMTGILLAFGTNYIVQGCIATYGNCSAGYIMLGGELLQVDSHTPSNNYFEKVVTYDSSGDTVFQQGGTAKQLYQKNRGVMSVGSGALGGNGINLLDLVYQRLATIPKIFNIGAWNMLTTASIAISLSTLGVAESLAGASRIKSISVIIISDDNAIYLPLNTVDPSTFVAQGYWRIIDDGMGGWNLHLYTKTGGIFNVANFSSALNRGFITIGYK